MDKPETLATLNLVHKTQDEDKQKTPQHRQLKDGQHRPTNKNKYIVFL